MKATDTKNNYSIKIKIINKIQCAEIHKNYVCVVIYLFRNAKSNRIE